jgi:hypothetical protein
VYTWGGLDHHPALSIHQTQWSWRLLPSASWPPATGPFQGRTTRAATTARSSSLSVSPALNHTWGLSGLKGGGGGVDPRLLCAPDDLVVHTKSCGSIDPGCYNCAEFTFVRVACPESVVL